MVETTQATIFPSWDKLRNYIAKKSGILTENYLFERLGYAFNDRLKDDGFTQTITKIALDDKYKEQIKEGEVVGILSRDAIGLIDVLYIPREMLKKSALKK